MSVHGSPLRVCRSCDQRHLRDILSLGRMLLAKALLTADQLAQSEETLPLATLMCRCSEFS
ncbi:MAG: hypothetical protein KKC28_14920 [Verrucomicrobia bacterium]|nr:hypothetical protein [Verrucomicrobiota bacterium]